MEHLTRREIEDLLELRIRNISFYREALTHKSAVKLYNVPRSNERLEFIGDAVLNLIVTKYIYEKFPDENEGFLTKIRMKIVSGKMLSKIAKEINIKNHIRMNTKALKQNWNENERILEDALEALIGAIYFDMGFYHTTKFVHRLIDVYVTDKYLLEDNNYKDILMRYTQSNCYKLPTYETSKETGPDHKKMFTINVYINDSLYGQGSAKIKKQAEQIAAKEALIKLEIDLV